MTVLVRERLFVAGWVRARCIVSVQGHDDENAEDQHVVGRDSLQCTRPLTNNPVKA